MKAILIGSVGSSKEMLQAMIDVGFPVSCVFSLDEAASGPVSGYQPIHELAAANGIRYQKFKKINDEENVALIREIAPDLVGFHPTALPKMRGRAANVWQVLLGVHEAKVSLFFIDEGTDSGDILGQEPYYIEDTDYAEDVGRKIDEAASVLSRTASPKYSR